MVLFYFYLQLESSNETVEWKMPYAKRTRDYVYVLLVLFLIVCYRYRYEILGFGPQGLGSQVKPPTLPLADGTSQIIVEPPVPVLSDSLPSSSTSSVSRTTATTIPLSTPQSSLDSSDVLLIFKTSATTIWRRMPIHLTTTLSDGKVPNSVVYSDLSEQLATNIAAIDVLSNESSLLQRYDASAYSSYLELQSPPHANTYREHAVLPGDEPIETSMGNPPDWLLDKYKFLPMLTHAQRNWPGLKWYIYIEDDTYIFLNNVLRWLAALPLDEKPSYYGAYSGEGNATFAQGGSGIVFSRSLMKTVFGGTNIPDLQKYGNYAANSCCGDMILGKVLRDQGISVNRGELGPVSFRPEPPWKTGFESNIWCSPVFTFHHLHQRDLVQLAQLEHAHGESSLSAVSHPQSNTMLNKILTIP